MVVPIRESGNITQSPAIMSSNSLKLVFKEDIDIVTDPIGAIFNLNNNLDKVRDCSLNVSAHRPRFSFISSSENKEEYYIHVQYKSDRMDKDKPVNSPSSVSRSLMVDFILFSLFTLFYFSFYFTFLFSFLFNFLFLEQLRLEFISHKLMA